MSPRKPILILSVLANVLLSGCVAALWIHATAGKPQAAVAGLKPGHANPSLSAQAPAETFAETWKRDTQGDLHALRDALRARGLPDYYINGLLAGVVMEKMRSRIRENYPQAGPYWKGSKEWRRTAVSRAYQTQRYNANMELLDLTGQISEYLEMPVAGVLYQRRLSWLSPEQRVGVQKIELDYRQLDLLKPEEKFDSLASLKQTQLLRQEKERDLRELLGDSALQEYALRDSPATNLAQDKLKYLNVSEAQFRAVCALGQKSLELERASNEAISYEQFVQTREAQSAWTTQQKAELQRILGDGLYRDLENSSKPEFTSIRNFARYRDIEATQIAAQSTAESSIVQRLDASDKSAEASKEERKQLLQQLSADLRAATQTNLGKDAEEYLATSSSLVWWRLQKDLNKLDKPALDDGASSTP